MLLILRQHKKTERVHLIFVLQMLGDDPLKLKALAFFLFGKKYLQKCCGWCVWFVCFFFPFPPSLHVYSLFCHFSSKFRDLQIICCEYVVIETTPLNWFMHHYVWFCSLHANAAVRVISSAKQKYTCHRYFTNISSECCFVFPISALATCWRYRETIAKGGVIKDQISLLCNSICSPIF